MGVGGYTFNVFFQKEKEKNEARPFVLETVISLFQLRKFPDHSDGVCSGVRRIYFILFIHTKACPGSVRFLTAFTAWCPGGLHGGGEELLCSGLSH